MIPLIFFNIDFSSFYRCHLHTLVPTGSWHCLLSTQHDETKKKVKKQPEHMEFLCKDILVNYNFSGKNLLSIDQPFPEFYSADDVVSDVIGLVCFYVGMSFLLLLGIQMLFTKIVYPHREPLRHVKELIMVQSMFDNLIMICCRSSS